MIFNKQDRSYVVTLSPSFRSRVNSAKGLSRWADRCFASLSMTFLVLVVKVHHRARGGEWNISHLFCQHSLSRPSCNLVINQWPITHSQIILLNLGITTHPAAAPRSPPRP